MKKILLSMFLLFSLGSTALADSSSSTPSGKNGLGVIFGEPTGFTGKFWLSPDRAFDVGLAFSFDSFVDIYGDYLFHFPGAFGARDEFSRGLTPYIGIGGELFISESSDRDDNHYFTSSGSSAGFGIRVPIGLEWVPRRTPVGIFAELVPGVGIIPSTFGFLQGGIGARYYF